MKYTRLSVPHIIRTLLILIPLILALVVIGRYLFQVLVNPKATSTSVGIYFERGVIQAPKDTLFDVHIRLLTTQSSSLVSGATVILKYPKQYLVFIPPTRGTTGYPGEDPLCRVLDYTLVVTDQPLDSDYNLITLTKGKLSSNATLPSGSFCFGTARFRVTQTSVPPTATITFAQTSPNWEFVGPVPYESTPVYKTDASLGQFQSVVIDTGITVLIVTPSVTPRPTVSPLPTIRPRPTKPPLPTIPPENTIIIYAGGTPGNGVYPTMQLLVNNRVVASWDNVNANGIARQTKQYTYNSPTRVRAQDQIRVSFINDYYTGSNNDRNLFVDKIIVGGYTKETEASSTYSTGTWSASNGCGPGFKKSEWLACNGSFIFSNLIPTGSINLL